MAVPLALVIYALSGANVLLPRRFGVPDETFSLIVQRCATAALTGFLIADLARRASLPWYDLIVLGLASFAVSSLSIDWLATMVREAPGSVAGHVISIAGSVEPGSVGAFLFLIVRIVVPLFCGLILALLITIASRYLLGLPLRSGDTGPEFRANLGGAYVWLAIVIVGHSAIRSIWTLGPGPRWLPFAAASLGGLTALAVQLRLAHRVRHDEFNHRQSLKGGGARGGLRLRMVLQPRHIRSHWLQAHERAGSSRAPHTVPSADSRYCSCWISCSRSLS